MGSEKNMHQIEELVLRHLPSYRVQDLLHHAQQTPFTSIKGLSGKLLHMLQAARWPHVFWAAAAEPAATGDTTAKVGCACNLC